MSKRVTNRLTDLKVRTVAKKASPMRVPDGRGLYLEVHRNGTPSWVFRYTLPKLNGAGVRVGSRERWAGLGSYPAVSLAEARDAADEMRRLLRAGQDPIEHRKREREARQEAERQAAAGAVTFRQVAENYIEAHRAGWRNAKHAAQWGTTLETYTYSHFGDTPVRDIDVEMILRALRPIWTEKPETATRVRQRIEAVLDSATARGLRTGENPARWRGHLDKLLPKRSKVAAVKHHAAMSYDALPAFWTDLSARDAMSARALAFTVLTASRSGEVRGATWGELDFDRALWTVPADRMKSRRSHRVPLPDIAVEILRSVEPKNAEANALIFPGSRGKPMSENTMRKYLIEDLEQPGLTVHGFRSTFRDWCGEETSFPRELAELSLAHVIHDDTEAAYRRGDALDRRRKLMDAWASFCTSASQESKVLRMERRAVR